MVCISTSLLLYIYEFVRTILIKKTFKSRIFDLNIVVKDPNSNLDKQTGKKSYYPSGISELIGHSKKGLRRNLRNLEKSIN